MLSSTAVWIAAFVTSHAPQWKLAPTPTPTPTPSGGGFDWGKVHPDPKAVPKTEFFYSLANAALFLGVVAALCGLVAGAIAFSVGPIFGAHIISDRGKSMMWKAGLVAIIIGSATSIISWAMTATTP